MGHQHVPLPLSVADHANDDLPRRRSHRRTDNAEADAGSRRRPVELHGRHASGRHRTTARWCPRPRPPCRHTGQWLGPVPRSTDTAATRRRSRRGSVPHVCRCSTAGSCGCWLTPAVVANWVAVGISMASCSTSATRSSTRSPSPSTSSPVAGRLPSEWRSAAAAPAVCWSVRA